MKNAVWFTPMTKKKNPAKAGTIRTKQRAISSFFQTSKPVQEGGDGTPDNPRPCPVDTPFNATVSKDQKKKSAASELDENDPRWAALFKRVTNEKGAEKKFVGKSMAEHILLWFDRSVRPHQDSKLSPLSPPHRNPQYGPGVGSTRLERFNRAKQLDLNPPEEVCRSFIDLSQFCSSYSSYAGRSDKY
jgi:hypothetical protein